MTAIFRAPELSATSRMERIWIIVTSSDFLRLLDDARHDPPLATAHRPALDDGHAVADGGVAGLVVGHELRRPALRLAVHVVPDLPLDSHDDGLLHLVADHNAGDLLTRHTYTTSFSRST